MLKPPANVATGALIHIVEDDEAIADSLKLLLTIQGYRVQTFASGAEFFQNAASGRCDCLILDVNLPGENGFEVLARLRKAGSTTPAIFVSGRPSHSTRAQSDAAQAVAYFDKPVPTAELLAAVAKATARAS